MAVAGDPDGGLHGAQCTGQRGRGQLSRPGDPGHGGQHPAARGRGGVHTDPGEHELIVVNMRLVRLSLSNRNNLVSDSSRMTFSY